MHQQRWIFQHIKLGGLSSLPDFMVVFGVIPDPPVTGLAWDPIDGDEKSHPGTADLQKLA